MVLVRDIAETKKLVAEGRELIAELRAVEQAGKKRAAEELIRLLEAAISKFRGLLVASDRNDLVAPAPFEMNLDLERALALAREQSNNFGRILFDNQKRIQNARRIFESICRDETIVAGEIKGSGIKFASDSKRMYAYAAQNLKGAIEHLKMIESDEGKEIRLYSGIMEFRQVSFRVGMEMVYRLIYEGSKQRYFAEKAKYYNKALDELRLILERAKMIRVLHQDLDKKARLLEGYIARLDNAFTLIAQKSKPF